MWNQQAGLGRQTTAADQKPVLYRKAEDVLGQNCPADLQGAMVPFGMTFYRKFKTLTDPLKVRDTPFEWPCKLCGTIGHEAFECEGEFQEKGKRHLSFRECFRRELCDKHGMYRR